ncbi:hypothetical protein EVAR_99808_1 [Eumeta japonica]|uniref:Uncharacterized protein n=1 Tax=Eumeta variegata TaxID=151549 RepID=A0A4C1ZAU0_EUMVA|nr:hypothetical protein EVAR_99808_1 [Eumeta japonica]
MKTPHTARRRAEFANSSRQIRHPPPNPSKLSGIDPLTRPSTADGAAGSRALRSTLARPKPYFIIGDRTSCPTAAKPRKVSGQYAS